MSPKTQTTRTFALHFPEDFRQFHLIQTSHRPHYTFKSTPLQSSRVPDVPAPGELQLPFGQLESPFFPMAPQPSPAHRVLTSLECLMSGAVSLLSAST